jgi:hypothetical protein
MNRMFIGPLTVIFFLFLIHPQGSADVKSPPASQAESCPVNLDLTLEESSSLLSFNASMTKLARYYGTTQFQAKLTRAITSEWPSKKAIDVSPTFLERTLNIIDQQYLKDSIAETVGLDSPDWQAFERVMSRVTQKEGLTENKHGEFTKTGQRLLESIKELAIGQSKNRTLTDQASLDIAKAKAVLRITNMVVYLERWSVINREIAKNRGQDARAKLTMAALGLTAGGIMGASLLYSSIIIDSATAFGASLTTNPAAAAVVSRITQTLAVGGLGGAGTPVSHFLVDAVGAHLNADYDAKTKSTLYVCELDKQLQNWKRAGTNPYLQDVLLGFGVGVGGTLLTYVAKAGAQFVLWTTTGLVLVSQTKPTLDAISNYAESEKERQEAMRAFFKKGDRQEAITHLKKSLALANQYHQDFLQVIVMATLTHAFTASFKTALLEGDRIVRALFANSADTIPQAANIAWGVVKKKDNVP